MSIQTIVTIIVVGLVWAMLLYGLRTFLYARKYEETDKRMKRSFKREQPLSFEEELAQDVLEIITVFSARLYGSRSKNQKLVERLRDAAGQL